MIQAGSRLHFARFFVWPCLLCYYGRSINTNRELEMAGGNPKARTPKVKKRAVKLTARRKKTKK